MPEGSEGPHYKEGYGGIDRITKFCRGMERILYALLPYHVEEENGNLQASIGRKQKNRKNQTTKMQGVTDNRRIDAAAGL